MCLMTTGPLGVRTNHSSSFAKRWDSRLSLTWQVGAAPESTTQPDAGELPPLPSIPFEVRGRMIDYGRQCFAAGEAKAGAEIAALQERLRQSAKIHTFFDVHRYLMANAHGRRDGAEKARRYRNLCCYYVSVYLGIDPDAVDLECAEYVAVHEATQDGLTDCLDESIGFPTDSRPDYDALAPLFFERFHELAVNALRAALGEELNETGGLR